MPKFSINFEEILSCAHGNFEEQNRVFKHSIIIINYCIILMHIITIIVLHSIISRGHAVEQLVEALCYKLEGRGFDSLSCHWDFSLT